VKKLNNWLRRKSCEYNISVTNGLFGMGSIQIMYTDNGNKKFNKIRHG
jgi:hypothetical protein